MTSMRSVLAFLIVAFAWPALGAERIISFHSNIDIAADGSMIVEETLRVVAQGDKIKQGIYRDFPTRYKDRHGNHFKVGFAVLGVSRDGAEEAWHDEDRANGVRVYIGKRGVYLSPGEYTYRIRYRTDRQLGFFAQHDELYWNVTGNGWAFTIDEASASVRLPVSVPAAELAMEGYTGAVGSKGGDFTADVADGVGRIHSTTPLASGEGLTLVFSWPKGIVREPTATQRIGHFFADNFGSLLSLLAVLCSGAYLFNAWRRYGRDPEAGVVFPHYEPPAGYSPASLRYVRRMGYDNATFTAAVINLAVKGYLRIEQEDQFLGFGKRYVLTKTASEEPLAPGEDALLRRLFLSGDTVKLENRNHTVVSGAREAHKKALKRDYLDLYFKTNAALLVPTMTLCLVAFILGAMFGSALNFYFAMFVVAVLMHFLFLWLMKAPSARGRRLMDKSEGFKLYLEVAEKDDLNLRNPPQLTPELFEAYLPFAFALGVEQQWADRFSAVFARLEATGNRSYQPHWYAGGFAANDMGSFSKAVGSGLNSAISSAAKAPGSSSGSAGGSSGGGGGGGGGGGW